VDPGEVPLSVRGTGLLTAVSVGTVGDEIASKVAESMVQSGVLVGVEQNVLFMVPPLGVTKAELVKATMVLRTCVQKVAGSGASKVGRKVGKKRRAKKSKGTPPADGVRDGGAVAGGEGRNRLSASVGGAAR
jgi:hypothetical protein